MEHDAAASQPVATILLVAITITVAALVLLLCLRFLPLPEWKIAMIPAIFVITNVLHTDDVTGALTYDSRVVILHTGGVSYANADLRANVFRNGQPVSCVIGTLNGDDFISTVHLGVQWIGGAGCSGATWAPGEMTAIDFSDGTFHPGDIVQIDIVDMSAKAVISRHSYRIP